ncbi:hypothetical protein [Marinomonas primoryensis]|jgi:hypothetical protein|uniref:hypothetical protein n=1 Tax=Marinomonas primoryensis TaxID=178399 RepID=UPI0030DCBD05|tara:strand:- start:2009 stop:2695 length:687 start_codon:yes stop_codon:yes gene_type:complete
MSFKDVEWWVCCAFIIIISYALGTLTGIPTWSEGDTKLSVFSNMATGIAGIATAFAAFYAYRSFNSWPERQKQQYILEDQRQREQHRLEQSTETLKELSRYYELVMLNLTPYCNETTRSRLSVKLALASKDTKLMEDCIKDLAQFDAAKDTFQNNLTAYKTAALNFEIIQVLDHLDIHSDKAILELYDRLTSPENKLNKNDREKAIALFQVEGADKIKALFVDLYKKA